MAVDQGGKTEEKEVKMSEEAIARPTMQRGKTA
jgi:hypothetical protein